MYEQGVIRPPSEAQSLLVRVTRNCPWNQCLFCPAYKGVKFSRRTVAEVKADIDAMAKEYGNHINMIKTAFLQDADSLILKTDQILEILRHIKVRFPSIERVTTYGRATTLKRKSVEEFMQLKEAGLTRIHAGLESGSEKVLKMKKMVDEGAFLPMTDEEIVAEIRLLVSCLDEIHSYFSCGDYSPNLLMQVNGYLDQEKAGMLSELDKFLSLWIAYNPLSWRAVRRCHSIAIARRNCRYRADNANMDSAPCRFSESL